MREEERKHLARELHDDLAQYLLALRMKISLFNLEFGRDHAGLTERTNEMIELIDGNMKIVRNVVSALRPTVLDIGIVSALEWLVDDFNAQRGIACRLHRRSENIALDERSAIAIFRIAQESLRNVARHADADEVDVVFESEGDTCLLEIKDNGRGFDPTAAASARNSFGLIGIQERVLMLEGKVDIISAAGRGTLIRVSIPIVVANPPE
jgi:signal transduction histidine kinase